jgi:hypothetical protein
MTKHTTKETISVLQEQIEVFRSQIQPTDTGHLYTTISTLEHRIRVLQVESISPPKDR